MLTEIPDREKPTREILYGLEKALKNTIKRAKEAEHQLGQSTTDTPMRSRLLREVVGIKKSVKAQLKDFKESDYADWVEWSWYNEKNVTALNAKTKTKSTDTTATQSATG